MKNQFQVVNTEKGKLLLVRTAMAELINKMYPRSVLSTKEQAVLIPWTLEATQAVADAGSHIVSPILVDYDFPGQKRPFKHQYKICSFLTANKRAFCFADMGTGKSLSCAWAVDYLLKIGEVKKILIVSPISVMNATWVQEFFDVNPQVTVTVLYGSREKREKLAEQNTQVHIINYDGLKVIENEIRANAYDLVIIDECTTYSVQPDMKKDKRTGKMKGYDSRWWTAYRLFKDTKYVWGLTGTPTLRGVEAAFGQAALVTPKTVAGLTKYRFKERVLRQVGPYTWVERPDAHEQVAKVLSPAIRIKKKDCIDLPPVVSLYREVELSDGQKRFYAELKRGSYVEDGDLQVTAVNGAVLMNKLLQVATGAIYDDDNQAHKFDVGSRITETIEAIERARAESDDPKLGKTLVFVPFKHTAEMLKREIREQRKDWKIGVITGETSEKERSKIFADFQNEVHPDLIIATPQTMSHGVTATAASCIVWFGPCVSAETYVQACNRIDRPGQRNDMTIIHLYATPVEWKLYKALQESRVSQSDLLKMYNDFIKGL